MCKYVDYFIFKFIKKSYISIIACNCGKLLVHDFTCVNTVSRSHLELTSKTAGSELKEYSTFENDYIFYPIAIETWGFCSYHSKIKNLVILKRDESENIFLIQKLSIAIQRENASYILGTIPNNKHQDEIFLGICFNKDFGR